GQQAHAVAVAEFRETVLVDTVQQVVWILNGSDTRQIACLSVFEELRYPPRRFIGHTAIADFARLYEILQSFQSLFNGHGVGLLAPRVRRAAEERGAAIRPMQLVKIEIVSLQPL